MAEHAVAEQHNDNSGNRAAAYRMLAVAVGITAAIALLLSVTLGVVAARSAVLGGLIFVLPNALFAGIALRRGTDNPAAAAIRGLYIGEALKLLATAVLFGAGFMLVKPLSVGVLFGTYLILLFTNLAGNAYLMK